MEFIPAFFLLIFLIFVTLSSGFKWSQPTYEIASLCKDNHASAPCPGERADAQCDKIANKPKSFAQKAAKAAKDASDAQVEAGAAAARLVQKQLAEKARSAAKAAEAAAAGKQQLVDQIESELREGKLVVHKERSRLLSTKTIAADARQGVKQAEAEVKALTEAVKNAQQSLANSERVVTGAQQALAEQQQAVAEAKERLELLLRQVEVARADFKNTKTAAENAACAAQEARQRASRERRGSEDSYSMRGVQGYVDSSHNYLPPVQQTYNRPGGQRSYRGPASSYSAPVLESF